MRCSFVACRLSLWLMTTVLVLFSKSCLNARPAPGFTVEENNSTWLNFDGFLNAGRGSEVRGISMIKQYFHRFGYLHLQDFDHISDIFDAGFESAVISYQAKLGLPISGKIDFNTLSEITAPRCGVPDDTVTHYTLHGTRKFEYFPGKPRWGRPIPMTLTYAFSPENSIDYLSLSDIRDVFKRAFARWASVIPVTFTESSDYVFADIKIGFYNGDHGDGEPFDGVLGVLAHSFSPESGRFHLDAAERWAVDFQSEKGKDAVDLESVAVHEIGHLLGLAHSSVRDAVMYPSLKPRKKKLELSVDDVQGVQALYGSNPNFTTGSLLESDISTNQAIDSIIRSSQLGATMAMFLVLYLSILI